MMFLYQYIGILVGVVAFIFTLMRFREGKLSLGMLTLWSGLWIIVILTSFYPNATSSLAIISGIGRGLDVILIIGITGCYYLLFKMFNMIESIEEEIDQLVREIALERGNSGKSSSQDEDSKIYN